MSELLGLRGRFAAALVAVSALTLAVTALLVLVPLDRKLEQDALTSLERDDARGPARRSSASGREQLRAGSPQLERADHDPAAPDRRRGVRVRRRLANAGRDGPRRTRSLPGGAAGVAGGPRRSRGWGGKRAGRRRRSPFRSRPAARAACSTCGARSTSLGGVQAVVRRSLVAAAFVALAVALVAGIALATRLVRRLSALRTTALEVAERGPDDTPPVEDGHRDEVGDLARAFATMQRRLAAQEQSRRTFVSTASHELRTPLTSLGLMLHGATEELAHEQPDLPEARDQLRRALGQTDRLSKLAAELLDLSRLDAGVQLRAEPVELVELARSVLAEFAAGELAGRARRRTGRRGCSRTRARSRGSPASCSTTPTATAKARRRAAGRARRDRGVGRRARRPARRGGADLRALPPRPGGRRGRRLRARPRDRPRARRADGRRATARRGTARRSAPPSRAAEDVWTTPRGTVPTRSQHDAHDGPIAPRHDRWRCSTSPPIWAIRSSSP